MNLSYDTSISFHSFCSGFAETAYFYIALLEIGEILQQRLYAGRTEENKHVVIKRFIFAEVVAHSAVHDSLGVRNLIGIKHAQIVAMHV